MAIKTVECPQCGTKLNVPATMGAAKCSACNRVFSTTEPQRAPPTRSSGSPASATIERGESNWVAWMVAGGVFALALAGIAGLVMFGGDSASEPTAVTNDGTVSKSDSDINGSATTDSVAASDFREVKLPESTRRKIFRDHQAMIASSFGKSKKIPHGGAAGQALDKMLTATVDREITRMALVYGISEDDIAQIILEGKAKGW